MDHAFYVRGRKVSLRLSKWTTTMPRKGGRLYEGYFAAVATTALDGTKRVLRLSASTLTVPPLDWSSDEEH